MMEVAGESRALRSPFESRMRAKSVSFRANSSHASEETTTSEAVENGVVLVRRAICSALMTY